MRFFVDTAHLEDIQAAFSLGIVSGVTTNPVIIRREDTRDIKGQIQQIRQVCDGEIFAQVLGKTTGEMVEQANIISGWDDNITVKIPLNMEGIRAVSQLSGMGIRTCTTITYNPAQALAAAVAGATYVALFVNRSNDMGNDGFGLVETVARLYREQGYQTRVLAASIDSPMDVVRAGLAGAQVVTAPLHTWTDLIRNRDTDETLESFLEGWKGDEIV